MEVQTISLTSIQAKRVAVLGYGNQGRAQALNLRDSGVSLTIGVRPGGSAERAKADGFRCDSFHDAVKKASVVLFLLPDHVTPQVYQQLLPELSAQPRFIGFAHGFAYHFKLIELVTHCSYFLVAPKGAGAILRDRFVKGLGLPMVYGVGQAPDSRATEQIALSYAKAIGARGLLHQTTFQEETECDLFGEQAVLCGGLLEMLEQAYTTLVQKGHSPEMAFFECCYEVKTIMDLFLKYGPVGMSKRISPTAFYGGTTRAKRLLNERTRAEMEKVFEEIRSGAFTKEWLGEVGAGFPMLRKRQEELKGSPLQLAYERLRATLEEE